MPFVSDAQRKYFNANRGKLEAQGVDVGEWNAASKGMSLPARARPPRLGAKKQSLGPTRLGAKIGKGPFD